MNQNPVEPPAKKKRKRSKEFKSIALIIFLVLVFRSIFFEPFKIPSGSMIPTLLIGDFILVNKLTYGLKLPFSHFFGDPVYLTGPRKPKRGDVIVFKYPRTPSINYIKRVVGLPGETIRILDKVVYIDGKVVPWKSIPGDEILEDMDEKFRKYNLSFYEVKTGSHNYVVQLNDDSYVNPEDSEGSVYRVPDNHYFVLGDNRDFSADSRYWGFVPFENIKGEAVLTWFSMILPFDGNKFKFRPWRIFNEID